MSHGFLLIDKPKGWTSHDVVGYLRKMTGVKKIGHAGTLDPFATGLLIIGVGREATKQLDIFKALPKTYEAVIKLGATSDTYDSTGLITPIANNSSLVNLTITDINGVLKKFLGTQQQTPPMYSAKKIGGKKLYELARKGIEVKRNPVEIEIYDLKLIEFPVRSNSKKQLNDSCLIRVTCSCGTYIRSLAHDIGQALGVGAYCDELRRTAVDSYRVESAVQPTVLSKEILLQRLFAL